MNTGLLNSVLVAVMIHFAAATTSAEEVRWNRVVPPGAGFSIEAPGEAQPSAELGPYVYKAGWWLLSVSTQAVDPDTKQLVERRQRKELVRCLETLGDRFAAGVGARRRDSSSGDVDGNPSLRFSLENADLEGTNLIVLTADHLYLVMTVGPKGSSNADAKRFIRGFRLVSTDPRSAADSHELAAPPARPVPATLTSGATLGPEHAVRDFIRALAMHDTQAFSRAVRPDPRASRFINPEPLTPEGHAEAARRLETLQVRRSDRVLLRGEPVESDARGDYPVGSVARFIASGNGGPALVTVVREPDGWKVDLRWWLAMLDMADARPPAAGSPEHAVRSLTLALIALNRDEASRFVAPGAEMSVLFAGAPTVREPSGVLEASAMEMPLVEVGAGEFYRLPSGRIVEGSTSGDRKVIVGQFGPVEMPFVLRRVGGTWRVEAEPYFALINRPAHILRPRST